MFFIIFISDFDEKSRFLSDAIESEDDLGGI